MLQSKAWNIFTWIFIALAVTNIVAHNAFIEPNVFTAQNYVFHVITKPLIMLSALCFLTKYLSHKEYQNWILVAFIYSLLGDILVMGQSINDLFFAGGLAAFFVAHASYIVYFRSSAGAWFGRNAAIQVLQAAVVLYAMGLYLLMLPDLGALWIPVLLYQAVLAVLGVVALGGVGRVNFNSYAYTIIGTFSLILCNSIFAYNKFIDKIAFASVLITLFYCFGHYMILKGFMALHTQEGSEPLNA